MDDWNEHVRDVEDDALHTGGQTDLHDSQELIHVEVQTAQVEMAHAVRFYKAQHGQRRRDTLAEHGGDRSSGNAHAEHAHKQQVAQHIHHACRHQEVQRPPRVTHRTQHGGTEVVDHGRRHADKYTCMYSTAPSMTSSGVFISVSMGRASTTPSTTRITPPTRPVSSEVCRRSAARRRSFSRRSSAPRARSRPPKCR